jgi:transglutaminase-like putative cysteine protease
LQYAPSSETPTDAVTELRSAVADPEEAATRTLVLEQRIRYAYSRPVTNVLQRLRIVPPPLHGEQRRRRWHLAVHGAESSSQQTFLDPFGNVTVDVSVPRVHDSVEFRLEVEAEPDGRGSAGDIIADAIYLRHTRLTSPDEALTELALAGGGDDIAALCERVHRSIVYEWGVTGVRTTASEALAGGRGVCQDFAQIMLTTCRIAGVAARYVSGHLTGEGGSHAWVEVLRPHPARAGVCVAEGWDPANNRRTNGDYLVVATGRDYVDVAPLSGTYDGRDASNALNVDKRLALN